MEVYNNFDEFLKGLDNVIIRFRVYKKMYTPYEIVQEFIDESVYESAYASNGIIRECVPLVDGDYLLGIQTIFDEHNFQDTADYDMLEYYKLSEIRMEYYRDDQPEQEEQEI